VISSLKIKGKSFIMMEVFLKDRLIGKICSVMEFLHLKIIVNLKDKLLMENQREMVF